MSHKLLATLVAGLQVVFAAAKRCDLQEGRTECLSCGKTEGSSSFLILAKCMAAALNSPLVPRAWTAAAGSCGWRSQSWFGMLSESHWTNSILLAGLVEVPECSLAQNLREEHLAHRAIPKRADRLHHLLLNHNVLKVADEPVDVAVGAQSIVTCAFTMNLRLLCSS